MDALPGTPTIIAAVHYRETARVDNVRVRTRNGDVPDVEGAGAISRHDDGRRFPRASIVVGCPERRLLFLLPILAWALRDEVERPRGDVRHRNDRCPLDGRQRPPPSCYRKRAHAQS